MAGRTKGIVGTKRHGEKLSKFMVEADLAAQIRREASRFGMGVDQYLRESMLAYLHLTRERLNAAPPPRLPPKPPPVVELEHRPPPKPKPPSVPVAGFTVLCNELVVPIPTPSEHPFLEQIYELAVAVADEQVNAESLFMAWTRSFLTDPEAIGRTPGHMFGSVYRLASIRPEQSTWTAAKILAAYDSVTDADP